MTILVLLFRAILFALSHSAIFLGTKLFFDLFFFKYWCPHKKYLYHLQSDECWEIQLYYSSHWYRSKTAVDQGLTPVVLHKKCHQFGSSYYLQKYIVSSLLNRSWTISLHALLLHNFQIFSIKFYDFIVSNAFLKSRNTPQVNSSLSRPFLIVSVRSIKAWLVECLFLKPNCFEKGTCFFLRTLRVYPRWVLQIIYWY